MISSSQIAKNEDYLKHLGFVELTPGNWHKVVRRWWFWKAGIYINIKYLEYGRNSFGETYQLYSYRHMAYDLHFDFAGLVSSIDCH